MYILFKCDPDLKVAHSSLVSALRAVGLEVPQRLVAEVESFSPSLNMTFILKGTTENNQMRGDQV